MQNHELALLTGQNQPNIHINDLNPPNVSKSTTTQNG